MKKILIIILSLVALIIMMVCTNKFIENKKIYKMHEQIFPKVKNYYETLGYKLEDKTDDYEEEFDCDDFIVYKYLNENNTKDEITEIEYVLMNDSDKTRKFLNTFILMNANEEDYKAGNFKFEESPFSKLNELLEVKDVDYSNINKQVYDYYNGNGSDSIEIKNDDKYFVILYLSSEKIAYSIRIYS